MSGRVPAQWKAGFHEVHSSGLVGGQVRQLTQGSKAGAMLQTNLEPTKTRLMFTARK